ncbi:MAG: ribose-phosphate diphosphokinase [Deltaproteobacteria bacterium]|nr:ribose-phosphate diphosphokinase [Deltaproteobacteria bacterium]
MKSFLTDSTKHLRSSLTRHGCTIGRYKSSAFADRERGYLLKEDVKGESIAIIASVLPAPESLFDLMALHRLLLENGAAEIDLIVPYLGYARQDRSDGKGTAGIGAMVAELLRQTKASRLIVCDIHSERIRKALGPSVIELCTLPIIAAAVAKRPPEVVIAPDAGSIPRARRLAELLAPHPEVALIDKVRPRPNVAVAKRLQGDVRGRNVLIIDDMIDTGGTLVEAVKLVLENGAATIRIAATHGIFSDGARERLSLLPVSEILVTNTLPQVRHPKIRCLDIVPSLLAVG